MEIFKSDFKLWSLEATAIPAHPPPIMSTSECYEFPIINILT